MTTNNSQVSPKISIVMAAYNEEKNISKAIESIISQTFTEWELIIIDDGSVDNTSNIVEEFIRNDSRISLVRNTTNLQLPDSLNRGINLARADLIARADADDVNLPMRFEKQYDFMAKNLEVDILGTGAYLINKNGERRSAVSLPCTHEEIKEFTFLKTPFFHSSVIIRNVFFNKVGLYDKNYKRFEDKELWLRGLRQGCCYANLPDQLIEYSTNDYKLSWDSIKKQTLSSIHLAHSYNVKGGYALMLLLFVITIAIKLNIHKPKTI